jgi:replicative DNA helicase
MAGHASQEEYILRLKERYGDGRGFLDRDVRSYQRPMRLGIGNLDSALGGGLVSGVSIFAAEPGGGKSVLGLQAAANVARSGRPSLVFEAEMDLATCRHRLYSMLSYCSDDAPERFTSGSASIGRQLERYRQEGEASPIAWAERKLESECFLMAILAKSDNPEDHGAVTLEFIEDTVKQTCEAGICPLVVIDYCQILRMRDAAADALGEYERTTVISRRVAEMAKRFNVPVMMLSQMSRTGGRDNGRPGMHSLRGSGQLEQDARLVATIEKDQHSEPNAQGGVPVMLTIHKNRSGIAGAQCPLWLYGGYNYLSK